MYVRPQVEVHQELEATPAPNVTPLYACVVGPQYNLIRYAEAAEKQLGALGSFVNGTDTCYVWPNRPAGGVVDNAYTRLFADNAYLNYLSDTGTIPASGDANRVTSATVNFKTFGAYTRDSSLKSRDVQVGDGVRIVGTGTGGDDYDILTKVTGFEHADVAATVDTAAADTDNQADTTAAVSSSMTAGTDNNIQIASEDGASYDGVESGYLTETYTIEVIQGGAPTAARLKVVSDSGTDNQASITPAAFASPTSIGTRGLTVTFNDAGSGVATPQDVFVEGQIWEVEVTQDYTAATVAEGGTYTGTADTTYIIEVTEGGDLGAVTDADKPKISVRTSTGNDFGGPYAVATTVAQAIGNYGVTVAFTGDALVTGDKFTIATTAATDGAIKTLVLADAMPSDLQGETVSFDLYIIKDAEIPEVSLISVADQYFTQSSTEICVDGTIQLTDASWYDTSTGELELMNLYQADLFVQYRSLIQDNTNSVKVFNLEDLGAQITPDNPFIYGLYKALSNSGGTAVRGVAVKTNDIAGYTVAMDKLTIRTDVWGVVPLTQDRAIQDLVAAHVLALSSPEEGRWRTAWLNSAAPGEEAVYAETSDGDMLMLTVVDDDTTTGTQYTKVVISDGELLANGVRSGDILRVGYTIDTTGATVYDEYTIDRVVSEDVAILASGPDSAINTASRAEIWRDLTGAEVAANYATVSGSFGDRRIRHIWPDVIKAAGEEVKGYHLCAALAGLRSGSAPHQGLTNVEILGFESVERSTEFLAKSELDLMAEAGTWIVTQDSETGNIYSRHQLTTGNYDDQNEREDSITSNFDSISFYILNQTAPYIGKANVTPEFIGVLDVVLDKAFATFTQSNTATLGPQIIEYDVVELRQHAVLRDRIVARVNLSLPSPFNNADLYLVI